MRIGQESVNGSLQRWNLFIVCYSCFVVEILYLPNMFDKPNLFFSHCRHRAILVKLVTGQTISTQYTADWLLDVDLKITLFIGNEA